MDYICNVIISGYVIVALPGLRHPSPPLAGGGVSFVGSQICCGIGRMGFFSLDVIVLICTVFNICPRYSNSYVQQSATHPVRLR